MYAINVCNLLLGNPCNRIKDSEKLNVTTTIFGKSLEYHKLVMSTPSIGGFR